MRTKYSYMIRCVYFLLILSFVHSSNVMAQFPSLQTTIDKKNILIGEPFNIHLSATFPIADYRLHLPVFPDSLAHFEKLDQSKPDTIRDKELITVQQTIRFTSFDSGAWNTPSLPVNFDPVKDDTTYNQWIDSFLVNVNYAVPDSSGQLRDIKPIRNVSLPSEWWKYTMIAVGVLVFLLGIWWWFKKRRKKNPLLSAKDQLSALEEALLAIKQLEQLNLQQRADIKIFHTRLSFIFRQYISRRLQKNMLGNTSYDVLIHLANDGFEQDRLREIAIALRTGDAVKFAKYLPAEEDSRRCKEMIIAAIQFLSNHSTKSS